jgi:HSP20 family molecular chaperone IbpA
MALPVRIARAHGHHGQVDPLDVARNDINGMLRLFGRGLFGDDLEGGPLGSIGNYGVDIREDENHVYVIADLPGFRKEDVDIAIEDGTLTIVAERREEVAVIPGQQQDGQAGQRGGQQAGQQAGQQGQTGQQQQQSRQEDGGATAQSGQGEGQGEYLLRERRIQRFVRSFTLPPNVDDQHVQARLENGVLTITLNKREESKPRRVQVS